MKVLVTGAAGFIGFHTSKELLKKGYHVIGLDNINNYYPISLKIDRLKELGIYVDVNDKNSLRYEARNFTFIYGDIVDKQLWQILNEYKIDKVIHLAAQAGVRYSLLNPDLYIDSNIVGFQNILEFCSKQSITGLLYASSSSVYGKNSAQPFSETDLCNQPESFYAATKRFNELAAYSYYKTKNVSSIGMRFFTVYGPWGRPDMAPMIFADAALNGRSVSVFNYGNQMRDFTYIDDVVKSVILLFEKMIDANYNGAEVINIGRGSPVSLMDFIELIEKYFKKELEKHFVEEQSGDVAITFADTTKLLNFISEFPYTNLDEGLKHFCYWYLDYYKK